MGGRDITLSVVSHEQNALVNQLLQDVERHCARDVEIILTQNVADATVFLVSDPVQVIVNDAPRGFGANHNTAFARCRTEFFCVANPDVRLTRNPFAPLLQSLAQPDAGVAGPLVRNPAGGIEDSARRFPTAASLARKFFVPTQGPDYPVDRGALAVDWIAGMFMLFRADTYRALGGFDEAYFLYYEDVDLCRRLRRLGKRVIFNPQSEIIHDARRASRRDPRLARHHAASVLRFLLRG